MPVEGSREVTLPDAEDEEEIVPEAGWTGAPWTMGAPETMETASLVPAR